MLVKIHRFQVLQQCSIVRAKNRILCFLLLLFVIVIGHISAKSLNC